MSNLDQLQSGLLAEIDAATDLAEIEAIRVKALGKQGLVTALLKTLGGMSPEQRQIEGPRIQGAREAVADAIATRKAALEAAALDARLATERLDMTLPCRARATGQRPPGQPGDGRTG